jgi:hypothetical protein
MIEYAELLEIQENSPTQGTALINSCYKIRYAIASKVKGKSGGAWAITYVQVVDNNVFCLPFMINPSMKIFLIKKLKNYFLSSNN